MKKRNAGKTTGLLEAYNTTWTDRDRANWLALGEFIARLRTQGKGGTIR